MMFYLRDGESDLEGFWAAKLLAEIAIKVFLSPAGPLGRKQQRW